MTTPPLLTLARAGAALAVKSATGAIRVNRYDWADGRINFQLQQEEASGTDEDSVAEVICNINDGDWKRARYTAEFFQWCAANVPTLVAAVERLAGAVSGDGEALGRVVRSALYDMPIEEVDERCGAINERTREDYRRIGTRLHALGAASAAAELADLRSALSDAVQRQDEISVDCARAAAERIEAARAEGAASRDEEVAAMFREIKRQAAEIRRYQFAMDGPDRDLTTPEKIEGRIDHLKREVQAAKEAHADDLAAALERLANETAAARAEGYAAGLAAAAPPVLAAVAVLHGAAPVADTLSPPAMGEEESGR